MYGIGLAAIKKHVRAVVVLVGCFRTGSDLVQRLCGRFSRRGNNHPKVTILPTTAI